jgi:hypothetical protein
LPPEADDSRQDDKAPVLPEVPLALTYSAQARALFAVDRSNPIGGGTVRLFRIRLDGRTELLAQGYGIAQDAQVLPHGERARPRRALRDAPAPGALRRGRDRRVRAEAEADSAPQGGGAPGRRAVPAAGGALLLVGCKSPERELAREYARV